MAATLEHRLARRRVFHRIDAILPLDLSKQTPMLEVRPGPIGKTGGPGLWHVKGMGFPPYFQNVRNALIRNGHSTATASQITWGAIRRWARGGGNVHPEVRTAAKRALASIAGKEARAHAQSATRSYTTLRDQLTLREFSRSGCAVELADPYHSSVGRFTSAGNQGSAAPKQPTATQPGTAKSPPPTISPQQKAKLLAQAAADQAKAQLLRQEAAKINKQIAALTALIAQQQKFLATSATGKTATGTGTATTGAAAGTQTKTPSATQTPAQAAAQSAYFQSHPFPTQKALAQNQAQLKQLTATRDALIHQAAQLDQQAQNLIRMANG
ncbi:MAG TPA: hypothetical protein VGR71_11840 [Nitrospira sp.]|nr:hypothetical protein [Nitrospira sp.]